jgi:disulfide bond formation protein DsbB
LIYLLKDQEWRFFPVVFWILVNDIFDPAVGRRLLPVIGVFAFIGTIVGLGVAAVDAHLNFGPVKLMACLMHSKGIASCLEDSFI